MRGRRFVLFFGRAFLFFLVLLPASRPIGGQIGFRVIRYIQSVFGRIQACDGFPGRLCDAIVAYLILAVLAVVLASVVKAKWKVVIIAGVLLVISVLSYVFIIPYFSID